MGTSIVWALVRYRFPGRRLFDAIVDIPFALPTAVAGVALTQLFAQKGWLGGPLAELGIKVAFTPVGIFIAMIFIGIPFVVRTVQPVLLDLDPEIEEAAASLGANRWHTVFRVILPSMIPALLTGFALAFARAVGEYGSVIFIAGNLPNVSEIAPLLIVIRLSEFSLRPTPPPIAVVMLVASFLIIFAVNRLQRWAQPEFRRTEGRSIRPETLVNSPTPLRAYAPAAELNVASAASRKEIARMRRESEDRAGTGSFVIITLAISFLCVFVVLPLVVVFAQAFSKGVMAYFAALAEPEALSAIRLTLLVAAISVTLNLVFGVIAAWAIAKFDFAGKDVS